MQFAAELSTLETCWHCSSDTLLYVHTPSRLWWPVRDIMSCSSTRIRVELKSRRSGTLVGGVNNYFTELVVSYLTAKLVKFCIYFKHLWRKKVLWVTFHWVSLKWFWLLRCPYFIGALSNKMHCYSMVEVRYTPCITYTYHLTSTSGNEVYFVHLLQK